MNVVITGGAGFLGQRLARQLLSSGTLGGSGARQERIDRLVLFDREEANHLDDARIEVVTGDIANIDALRRVIRDDTASVFHLAAVVSGQAEREFDLGMRVNLDGARQVLEAARQTGTKPRVVFTSSVAVYGGVLPDLVLDTTALTPRSSYGVQKALGELLLSDYTRRGYVDGRIARLPTISVRPGRPNLAASSFASGIIREPLNGATAVCPVAREARLWLLSPRRAIEGLIALHDLPEELLGDNRAVNLPGLSVSVDDMVSALEAVAGSEAVSRILWLPDPAIERLVGSWPSAWDTTRADSLGLRADRDFESVIRSYIEDELN